MVTVVHCYHGEADFVVGRRKRVEGPRGEWGDVDFVTHCLAIATTVDGKSVLG